MTAWEPIAYDKISEHDIPINNHVEYVRALTEPLGIKLMHLEIGDER